LDTVGGVIINNGLIVGGVKSGIARTVRQSSSSLYSSASGTYEVYVLDELPIEDRKKEVRQLLKLLNLSKTGQPRSVLISGEPGIGKTALLDTFYDTVRNGIYCRIVDLRNAPPYKTAAEFYVCMINALREEADRLLDDALDAVNHINASMGVTWERQDLLRTIALVKLQESIGGKDAVTQERLVKALKSVMPTAKKLQFSTVNENIEQLINIIVNPWLLVASNLINPLVPQLQDAISLAEYLSTTTVALKNDFDPETSDSPKQLTTSKPPIDDDIPPQKSQPKSAKAKITIVDIQAEPFPESDAEALPISESDPTNNNTVDGNVVLDITDEPTTRPLIDDISGQYIESPDDNTASFSSAIPQYLPDETPFETTGHAMVLSRSEAPTNLSCEALAEQLTNVYQFINEAIHRMDTGILLLIDHWDQTLTLPEIDREEIKSVLVHFLRNTIEQNNFHLMVTLSCRSQGESDSLGGPLYGLFRNKMLLAGLSPVKRRKFFTQTFTQKGLQLDTRVLDQILTLTDGNPFWLKHYRHGLMERAEANQIRIIDQPFFEKLGVQQRQDLLESALTRVQLAMMGQGDDLFKVLAALIEQFGNNPFKVQPAIQELSTSQNVSEMLVVDVLRHLYLQGLINDSLSEDETPTYQIKERMVFDFLVNKTKAVKTDISTDDKMTYLRQVIPLSLQAGELDRQKTREVIALSSSLGDEAMVTFLQTLFLQHLNDEAHLVRLTAMNNLAILESREGLEAILQKTTDSEPIVREYAFRNLITLSRHNRENNLTEQLIARATDAIDDDSEEVRLQAYTLLVRYKWIRDLSSVLLKGLSDACEPIRVLAIEHLVELDLDAPLVKTAFLDAIDDPSPAVRKAACLGIQKIQGDRVADTVDTLVQMLNHDADADIRALAAASLSKLDNPEASEALVSQLNNPSTSEPVLLTILRALANRPGWETETLLLDLLDSHPDWQKALPAVYWTAIRTLGAVACTQRALTYLEAEQRQVTNELTIAAIQTAQRLIGERINTLQTLEKQLGLTTTPTTISATDTDLAPEEDV